MIQTAISPKIRHARLAVAQDIVALDKLRARLGESEDDPLPQRMSTVRQLSETEDGRAILKAQVLLENRLMQLATDRELRPFLTCWMIDFDGDEASLGSDVKVEEIAESDFMRAARADYGIVPPMVRAWLEDNDFEISDSSSGSEGWQLGVWCDDQEAARLCSLAHAELETEMAAGVFRMALKFWGWKFTDVSTLQEARAFLETELS